MNSESKRLRQEILDLKNLTQAVIARNVKLKKELAKMQEEELGKPRFSSAFKND